MNHDDTSGAVWERVTQKQQAHGIEICHPAGILETDGLQIRVILAVPEPSSRQRPPS